MSKPLAAQQFQTLVRKSGIPATFYDGWATRNRGQRGDGWGITAKNPTGVHGVMLHHTATRDAARTISIARDIGQSDEVPPPLYAGLVDKSGHLHMVGWGRCNHAGLGDDDVLRAVIAERSQLPRPNEANTDGNARFYGFAGINLGDGEDPWPEPQLNTMARVSALVCRHHRWTQRSVIGHLEWQPGKPDPRGGAEFAAQGGLIYNLRGRVLAELG
jgi:hypothetical protein